MAKAEGLQMAQAQWEFLTLPLRSDPRGHPADSRALLCPPPPWFSHVSPLMSAPDTETDAEPVRAGGTGAIVGLAWKGVGGDLGPCERVPGLLLHGLCGRG